jgi:high frequency lysogenization protein
MVMYVWEELSLISRLNSNQQRVLALAAVVQAATLVHQVASTGKADEAASRTCMASLFVTSPESTEDVFGGYQAIQNLRLGLETLKGILNQDQSVAAREITRYVLGLTHLQGKLRKRPIMLEAIGQQLSRSQRQVDLYDVTHAIVLASVAETYSSTLSSFHFRIQVTGNPTYLQQPMNTNRVRSYLLAGIRATTLWRQVGGRKWQLVLFKNSLQRELTALLNQLNPT